MNEERHRRYTQLLVRRAVDPRTGEPLYSYGQATHRDLVALPVSRLAEVVLQLEALADAYRRTQQGLRSPDGQHQGASAG
ncbi:MAG: hypothetical protein GY788_24090 [bacterium]|nr:hypothetical protein [bacterium]